LPWQPQKLAAQQQRGAHYTDQICFVNPFLLPSFTADVPANLLSPQPGKLAARQRRGAHYIDRKTSVNLFIALFYCHSLPANLLSGSHINLLLDNEEARIL
jgi:hypothetical protein